MTALAKAATLFAAMIDLNNETIGSLSEIARLLPPYRGRRLHPSTLWRWSARGLKGVRLETVRFGGRILCSVEAVTRFSAKLAELDQQQAYNDPLPVRQKPRKRTPMQRDRDVARARRELERAGIR